VWWSDGLGIAEEEARSKRGGGRGKEEEMLFRIFSIQI
jgi:hypothetical protein